MTLLVCADEIDHLDVTIWALGGLDFRMVKKRQHCLEKESFAWTLEIDLS